MAVCPAGAIIMREDGSGFSYPEVQADLCIHCDRCDAVCLLKNRNSYEQTDPSATFYAACLKEQKDLEEVSSGGVFWALTQQVIADGGVVYGAAMISPEQVIHRRAESTEEAKAFRRSKYTVSHPGGIYRELEKDIRENREVLFSGLPCQIAAVYAFLRERPKNLITCEVICHGQPSPLAYRSYLTEQKALKNSAITSIVFRDKTAKWRNNRYAVTFENGTVEREPSVSNAYHKAYLDGLIDRESCHDCAFARLPRTADITLADFWKYRGELLEKSGENGVSLVLLTGDGGKDLFLRSKGFLHVEDAEQSAALKSCYHMSHAPVRNPFRNVFLRNVKRYGLTEAQKRFTAFHAFASRNIIRLKNLFTANRG